MSNRTAELIAASPGEQLVLLVGTNPLPNLVAALCLLGEPSRAQLLFVYSSHTEVQCQKLEEALLGRGFTKQQFVRIPVEEANPESISNEVVRHVQNLKGLIILHYTGGTKAMAVHAYRALETLFKERIIAAVQFSYLDAHSLSMHSIDSHGAMLRQHVGLACEIPLQEVLRLHSRESSMKPAPLWPRTVQAITELHAAQAGREAWKQWVAQTFLAEPKWPVPGETDPQQRDEAWKTWVRQTLLWNSSAQRKWKPNSAVVFGETDQLAHVLQTLRAEAGITGELSAAALKAQGGFKDTGACGKWFEGEWIESYVLGQVLALKQRPGNPYYIGEAARDLQAIGPQQVQVDVAFMRGYQLFVIACTTDKSLAKSKLLEAVVRAEQLGGAEARVALVCCADDLATLKAEVEDLLATKVAVFSAAHLPVLQDKLSDWVDAVS